jgi:SAM-dependent methyltransferase
MDPALDLQTVYQNRFSESEKKRQVVWQVLTRDFFQQWVRPDDSVLDVGAGYCEFINNINAKTKYALDLNPTTTSAAAAGVNVVSQDISEPWQLADASVNVVFSSNFLEHLNSKDDVLHCLREVRRVLKPDGTVILLGPNIRFCNTAYWDFFDHYIPLSDRSIVEALQLSGFECTRVVDRFLPFTMKGKKPTYPFLISAYLKMPFVWNIFGQQFLVIGKPAKG